MTLVRFHVANGSFLRGIMHEECLQNRLDTSAYFVARSIRRERKVAIVIRHHKQAKITVMVPAWSQANNELAWMRTDRFGITVQTMYRWKNGNIIHICIQLQHFRSGEKIETKMCHYILLYNQQSFKYALGSIALMRTMHVKNRRYEIKALTYCEIIHPKLNDHLSHQPEIQILLHQAWRLSGYCVT